MSIFREVIQDSTAFGGLPIYLIAMIIFFIAGYNSVSYKLFVGLVMCYVVVIAIRAVYFKLRPDRQSYSNWIEKIDSSSFPSLHSMRAVLLSGIVAYFLNAYFGWILAFLVVFIVAFTRIVLQRHYVADVFGGVVIGLIILFMIVLL